MDWLVRASTAIQQRLSDPLQLVREYQHVLQLDKAIPASYEAARSRAAAGKNRYGNVSPFDHNRVVLPGSGGYINASSVEVTVPTLQQPCRWIATQGPLPGTAGDFWAMVLDLRLPAVVMLTNVAEAGVTKCAQYFPTRPGQAASYGGIRVQVEGEEQFSPDCCLRHLLLSRASDSSSHALRHFHFHAWPDHGVPASSSGLRGLCRALRQDDAGGKPVVVHCSAGIGRTGTFCAIDVLLRRLDAWPGLAGSGSLRRSEVEAALDVPHLVHALRRQRAGMVQTQEQYTFVYAAVADDLAEARRRG